MSDKPVSLQAKKDNSASVREQLQEMLDRADSLSGVVIVAHIKGGGEYLRTSSMSKPEKAACFAIFQSYINDLFRCDEE